MEKKCKLCITTCALSRGNDFDGVRCVIHWNPPDFIEDYYQQTGRGGRDGNPCYCFLFLTNKKVKDSEKPKRNNVRVEDEQKKNMKSFITATGCRKAALLNTLAETNINDNCKKCDLCLKIKAVSDLDKILKSDIVNKAAVIPKNVNNLTAFRRKRALEKKQPLVKLLIDKRKEIAESKKLHPLFITSTYAIECLAISDCLTANEILEDICVMKNIQYANEYAKVLEAYYSKK